MGTLINVLRLFFNSVAATINSVIGANGGRFLESPNGLFFDILDQPLAVVNTAQAVRFRSPYLVNGFEINGGSNTEITALYSGIYNFQFTGILRSNSGSSKIGFLWISRNGVDIGYSAKEYSLSGAGKEIEISWTFLIDLQGGDYIEMKWSGNDIDMSLDAVAPTAPHPGVSSAVVAITFVSALPEVLPTPP
jgi:hypothetical protein